MINSPPNSLALSRDSFGRFCRFITDEIGIKMSPAKLPMLQSRLQRRLRELQIPTLEAYQKFLFESPDSEAERVHFIDAVTTNKTDFFREPQHFDYLTRTALPTLDRGPAGGRPWPFKLWCAGCSSGEEPYTLAMVLAEFAAQRPGFEFSLLATDISSRVLEQAASGVYAAGRIEPVAGPLRSKYLMRGKDPARAVVRVVPELRKRIAFHRLNFMDADYGVKEDFEVIFFRNVMIYFDKPTQEAVIGKLCRNLVPGGYLFVGHSESLAGLDIPVNSVGMSIYRKPR
jgi:chemotaxis protein methyltransferase CheR